MTMGYRFTEDEADEYMKFIDPKNEGKFLYIDLVKKILKWIIYIYIYIQKYIAYFLFNNNSNLFR